MTNDVILALNEIGSIRPQGRYAYLNFLGVRPSEQRRGIGHGLMRTGLARSHALGLGVHLETTNSTNFGFYRSPGFEVATDMTLHSSGPRLWAMWRPAMPSS